MVSNLFAVISLQIDNKSISISNSHTHFLQAITYTATDLLLGEETWINETSACTFPEPWIKVPPFPDVKFETKEQDHPLESYIGTFGNDLLGDMVVRKSETDDKALSFTMSHVTGQLLPEGANVFRLFLDGNFNHLRQPEEGKHPLPFLRYALIEF